jgi:DNA-binding NarL/FixJ family response regulator
LLEVLATLPEPEPDETEDLALGPLSWRDERLLEVAAMVAEGLTNKQIADGLHVSLRTVEADVRDLKTVLGVRSRAQIAAWATQAR